MRLFTISTSVLFGVLALTTILNFNPIGNSSQPEPTIQAEAKLSNSIYDYSFTTLAGKKISLSKYKGKKILFVNTASECGYTPQYEGLEALYEKYKKNMIIIGFPTNDFGGQEPGTNDDIKTFCSSKYKVSFPMSQKITVKGDATDPIYKWLTQTALNGKMDSEVKWNFQKYLVNEKGELVAVYKSAVKPDSEEISKELKTAK